jgi:glycosyltransferase involved in cell wall biosynthesis
MSRPAGVRICLVTPEFGPEQWGGLAKTAGRVAAHGRDLGHEVHVAHLVVGEGPGVRLDRDRRQEFLGDLIVHRLTVGREVLTNGRGPGGDCPHTLPLRMMHQALATLDRRVGFDLWHSFFLFPTGYVTGITARRLNRPHLATVVGDDLNRFAFSPEKIAALSFALNNADRIVTLSDDLADLADALVPVRAKTRVILNSVERPDRAWRPRPSPGPFKLGCAGLFKYAKGLPYLLAAVARLRRERSVVLELAGMAKESERRSMDSALAREELAGAVVMKGPIPPARMTDWLLSLDALVLPSLSEGCPNVLMEALAAGLPCVATAVGAVPRLIADGVSGRLVPWADAEALAVAVAELMDRPDRGAAWGAAAREAMGRFSAEAERRAWGEVYAELIGQ